MRVRLGACKTGLSPPPPRYLQLTVPRRYFCGGSNLSKLFQLCVTCCMTLGPPEYYLAAHLALCIFLFCQRYHCDHLTFNSCSPCFPLYMFYVGTYVYFHQHDFLISCLYLCLTEPLQKLRARLGAYKTGLRMFAANI